MSGEGNDTVALPGTNTRIIPIAVKDYNRMKSKSDMIVTAVMETSKVLAFWYFVIRSYATMPCTLGPLISFAKYNFHCI